MSVAIARPLSLPRPALELALAASTGAAHLTWHALALPRLPFLVVAIGGWGGYLVYLAVYETERFRALGFRTDNLWRAARGPTLIGVCGSAALLALGLHLGHGPYPLLAFATLALYPVWGVIQQFLVHGLVTSNLEKLGADRGLCVGVAATAFSLVHWGEPVLMWATFALGLVFTPMYLRHRNLIPLGVWHGWLGTALFVGALGLDPLSRVFPGTG